MNVHTVASCNEKPSYWVTMHYDNSARQQLYINAMYNLLAVYIAHKCPHILDWTLNPFWCVLIHKNALNKVLAKIPLTVICMYIGKRIIKAVQP